MNDETCPTCGNRPPKKADRRTRNMQARILKYPRPFHACRFVDTTIQIYDGNGSVLHAESLVEWALNQAAEAAEAAKENTP